MRLEDLPTVPEEPGVYLWKGPGGRVLYVGKARSLRDRVRSYFAGGPSEPAKARRLLAEAEDLETIVTGNEVEALLLEANLIKRHRPRYNVQLKDDKSFPYLKLTSEPFPMLIVTRRVVKDGGDYFGPYPDAGAVWRVKRLIQSVFPLRQNSGIPMKTRPKPCLNFHLHRCLGPCAGLVAEAEYAAMIEQVKQFLRGDTRRLMADLENQMAAAAQAQDFEYAARLRDRLRAVERLFGNRVVVTSPDEEDLDFIGVSAAGDYAMVQVFFMRNGRVVGRDKRLLTGAAEGAEAEAVARVVTDFYSRSVDIPADVLLPVDLEEIEAWREFLSERAGRKVELSTPERGRRRELVEMANRNAASALEGEIALLDRRGENPGLAELQQVLALPTRPSRIEGYDISNLFGAHPVGSMVVFEGGRPIRSGYRRFRVRGIEGANDFAMMHQVIGRRFTGRLADSLPLPDLILVDGGKGQVGMALQALEEANLEIPVVGLAKREERVVVPGRNDLLLPLNSLGLRVLMAVRDEAHRYGVTYHRSLREKGSMHSRLDDIPGIGESRRNALLESFTNLDEIRRASVEELARVPGFGPDLARRVKEFFESPVLAAADPGGDPVANRAREGEQE